jgi:signal transduction histidine kinase
VARVIDGLRRSRWREPLENPRLRAKMAPLPGQLGVGAIVLGGVTLTIHLLHPTSDYKPIPLTAVAANGGVTRMVALSQARRLTTASMAVLTATATLAITLSNYFVGAQSQPYGSMLYVWVGIAAVSFLSRRQAVLQIAFVAASYGFVLALRPGNPVPVVGWINVVGVVAASTLAIDTLFSRLGALADAERQARVRLEGIRSDLEEASRHKTRFLATMSHELRTPLNAILGFSEVLADEMFGPLSDKQREYVQDLTEAGHELLALVNDILDLAKVDAGRMELDVSDAVDVATVLRAACAATRPVPVEVRVSGDLGPVTADERKLCRIVANLVDEEAIGGGSTGVIVAADVTDGWLHVDVLHDGPGGMRVRTSPHLPGGGGPPLRVGVAAALAGLHGGAVDPIASGWRLSLPARSRAVAR